MRLNERVFHRGCCHWVGNPRPVVSRIKQVNLASLRHRFGKTFAYYSPSNRSYQRARSALRQAFYDVYWTEIAEACGAKLVDLGSGFRKIQRGSQWTITHGGNVMLDSSVMLRLAGNKPLIYQLLSDLGVDVPDHLVGDGSDLDPALKLMMRVPLVVKPASDTGAGAGVTTNITDERTLRRAVQYALHYGRKVLIEPFVPGRSYRLLYLDGELIDAIWRKSPGVVGDGVATLRELIQAENERRMGAAPPEALSLLRVDDEMHQTLARSDLTLSTVPAAGESVILKSVVNQNNRFENERVLGRVHPSIAQRCRDLCTSLRIELAGVDLILSDIETDWSSQDVVVNEINTTPGLHHHVLVSDGPTWTFAGQPILEHLLTRTQSNASGCASI